MCCSGLSRAPAVPEGSAGHARAAAAAAAGDEEGAAEAAEANLWRSAVCCASKEATSCSQGPPPPDKLLLLSLLPLLQGLLPSCPPTVLMALVGVAMQAGYTRLQGSGSDRPFGVCSRASLKNLCSDENRRSNVRFLLLSSPEDFEGPSPVSVSVPFSLGL